MTMSARLATLAMLVSMTAPVAASDKIKLATGKIVEGKATAYDAAKQELHFRLQDGTDTVYPLARLDARSVYLVHSSVVPKDSGKGQLQLANFARDAGLWEHAARRYGYAEKADPTLKDQVARERATLRQRAADFCLRNAKEAVARKDGKEAEKWLALMLERLPEEPQAAEASALLEASYTKSRADEEAAVSSAFREKLEKDVQSGKKAFDRMVESTQKGLTARNESQATKLWKSAIRDGEKVLAEIDRIEKRYGDDPAVRAGAARYRQLTRDQLIEANLHIASQSMVNSSLEKAEEHCNAALAIDSNNPRALAMRARIERAANEGLIRWW